MKPVRDPNDTAPTDEGPPDAAKVVAGLRPADARDPVDEAARRWAERYPDASRFRALTALVRTYGAAVRSIEQLLRPHDLNLSRFELLLVLAFTRSGELPTMRLRDVLMIHGSSVTYLVNRLEEAGLIERDDDPRDRRVSLVRITPAGLDRVGEACAALVASDFGVFSELDEPRLAQLSTLLGALRSANGGRGQDTATPFQKAT